VILKNLPPLTSDVKRPEVRFLFLQDPYVSRPFLFLPFDGKNGTLAFVHRLPSLFSSFDFRSACFCPTHPQATLPPYCPRVATSLRIRVSRRHRESWSTGAPKEVNRFGFGSYLDSLGSPHLAPPTFCTQHQSSSVPQKTILFSKTCVLSYKPNPRLFGSTYTVTCTR